MTDLTEIKEKLDKISKDLVLSNQKAAEEEVHRVVIETLSWGAILLSTFLTCYFLGKLL